MEMIIPADGHSPGAHAAQTSLLADLLVATEDDAVKKHWRDGLALMQKEAANSSLGGALEKAARNEANPQTELEKFFGSLKEMTVDAYYTSELGIHREMEYLGNTLPGCLSGVLSSRNIRAAGQLEKARNSQS